MADAQPRTSCSSLFKEVEIVPLPFQCILSLLNFDISNQEIFQTNSFIHNINTLSKLHLHRPNVNLSHFQKKSTFCDGLKIFNILPLNVTNLKNDKVKFRAALRKYPSTYSF
jgi:hypothetical protein